MKIHKQLSEGAILQELGGRIALDRLNRNLTQAQLAKEAGVSLSTVNRMEAGNSTQISNLVRVLRALGLTENLNLLIPQPAISPIQQLKLDGKSRKRARPTKDTVADKSGPWSWDEETTAKLKKQRAPKSGKPGSEQQDGEK